MTAAAPATPEEAAVAAAMLFDVIDAIADRRLDGRGATIWASATFRLIGCADPRPALAAQAAPPEWPLFAS